jgi:hypothetical protein
MPHCHSSGILGWAQPLRECARFVQVKIITAGTSPMLLGAYIELADIRSVLLVLIAQKSCEAFWRARIGHHGDFKQCCRSPGSTAALFIA